MKPVKKYSHLFFDLDNTLWDFSSNSYKAMKSAFDRVERQISKSEFDLFFETYSENNRLLWDQYRKGEVLKKELVILRFQKTFHELRITGIDPLAMNEIYLEEMPRQTRLVNGAEPVLEYLRTRGYEMFIITNGFTQVQHKKLESAGIKRYFKKVFISEQIMAPKPAPEIFEYALKSANAPKARSIMIGDDYESDIRGALDFGIDAVYLESGKDHRNTISGERLSFRNLLFRINALSELPEII